MEISTLRPHTERVVAGGGLGAARRLTSGYYKLCLGLLQGRLSTK